MENNIPEISRKRTLYFLGVFLFLLIFYFLFFSAPGDFPKGEIINIGEGDGLREVSFNLKENHVIRSRLAFEAFVIVYGAEHHIISADYLFEDRAPVFEVARRISKGERHLAPVKITIPEGFTNHDIAELCASKMPAFNKEKFLTEAKSLEGYLFPDTYFFFTDDTQQEVIKSMSKNFEKKIVPLRPEIIKSGKTEEEIITMASLIEGEAKGESDRGIISGILWKRFKMNMALQVDAAPETYKKRGLPKSPIGNPGIEAIRAAINPANSPYLYYLHGRDEEIHYARTFDEHRQNVLKYLK